MDTTIESNDPRVIGGQLMQIAMQALEEARTIQPQMVLWKFDQGGMCIPPPSSAVSTYLLETMLLPEVEPDAGFLIAPSLASKRRIPDDEVVDVAKEIENFKQENEAGYGEKRQCLVVLCQCHGDEFVLMQFYHQEPDEEGPVEWQEAAVLERGQALGRPFGDYFNKRQEH